MRCFPAKRMFHGVQPWPVDRVRAVGTLQGVAVEFKTCAACGNDFTGPGLECWRCEGDDLAPRAAVEGLRYEARGRAQRGLTCS